MIPRLIKVSFYLGPGHDGVDSEFWFIHGLAIIQENISVDPDGVDVGLDTAQIGRSRAGRISHLSIHAIRLFWSNYQLSFEINDKQLSAVLTLERAAYGNLSKVISVSSPGLPSFCPLKMREAVIVGMDIPSPKKKIMFLAAVLYFCLFSSSCNKRWPRFLQ